MRSTIVTTCNYKETENPSKVEFNQFATSDAAFAGLVAALETELKAYPEELLGVACPRRNDADALREQLGNSSIGRHVFPLKDLSPDGERRIYVTTLTDLKGLEFRTAHLMSMEMHYRLGKAQKRIAYTAITRAKTLLTVYSIAPITPYLQQAREALVSPAARVNPESLFPGKGGK